MGLRPAIPRRGRSTDRLGYTECGFAGCCASFGSLASGYKVKAPCRQVDRVVAIRDGKTSSETVRQSATSVSSKTEATTTGENVEEIFEEVVLLDSAGRLQVPRDYLEQLNIHGRVRLELTEEGILIRPARVPRKEQETSLPAREQAPAAESHGWRGWWKRIRSEGKSGRPQ